MSYDSVPSSETGSNQPSSTPTGWEPRSDAGSASWDQPQQRSGWSDADDVTAAGSGWEAQSASGGTASGWGEAPTTAQPAAGPSTSQPASQASASYPASQASASYPASQASASYPGGQASASYPGGQASGSDTSAMGYQPGQSGTAEPYGASTAAPMHAAAKSNSKDGIGALFDFSFKSYVTPAVAKVVYILGLVLGVFGYLGSVIGGFALAGAASYGIGDVVMVFAVFGIFTNLIGLGVYVIALRMIIEAILAQIRTAQYTRDMVEATKSEG